MKIKLLSMFFSDNLMQRSQKVFALCLSFFPSDATFLQREAHCNRKALPMPLHTTNLRKYYSVAEVSTISLVIQFTK
jgi:hypothetical protein